MAVEAPFANQTGSYTAEQTRRAIFALLARTSAGNPGIIAGGLIYPSDLQLSAPVSGMSVNVSTGECIIGGSEGGAQGGYYARATSQTNLAISASNPSNPRIDLVCATVSDTGYTEPTGGSGNQWAPQVITGTPTAGATLTNLNGVGTLPLSSLLLGYVLVPALATNIITADIANIAGLAVQGLPDYTYVAATGNTTAISGQWLVASPGVTITLPPPVKGATTAVNAALGVSGASPVLVQAGATGTINGTTIFRLGTAGATAVMQADGSNWWLQAGQFDSGWVALTLATNIGAAWYTPSVRVRSDMAELKGGLVNNTGGPVAIGATIATVPANAASVVFRPTATIDLGNYNNTAAPFASSISISTTGLIAPTVAWPAGAVLGLESLRYALA